MSNNYVQIKGSLGAEPEIRKMQNGKDIASMSIAVNERYFSKEDNAWKDKDTQWFRATAFGPLEISEARHLRTGSLVNATGRLKTSKYTDNEGIERISTEIIISSLEEVVRRKSGDAASAA